MKHHRAGIRTWAVALVLLLATACGDGSGADSSSFANDASDKETSSAEDRARERREAREKRERERDKARESDEPKVTGSAMPDAALQEFVDDYRGATEVIGTYWRTHWNEFFTGTYRAPTLVNGGYALPGIYDGNEGIAKCGGRPLVPDNAFYCIPDHTLSFDINLMVMSARDIGDSFVYMVVAHEWGHAVAEQINVEMQSVAGELVADCLSGAAIYGAVEDGELEIEEGDVKEITNGLTSVADEGPWGDPADHGDPFERIASFDIGRKNGAKACFKSS